MSFYNIFNELVSQEVILENLISYYQKLHDENKTKITDFTVGSEVRTLLEVLSHLGYNLLEEMNNITKNFFISTAEGEYLDLLGANPNINLIREQGSTANGLVKFTLANQTQGNINTEILIPAGTMVSNGEVEYETDVDCIIGVGESFTYCNVTCIIDGEDGNCKAGTINLINDLNTDFSLTCTNEEDFVNGADFEEDEEYRTRLLEFVRADNFGSRGYYENLLLNIPNVHDIKQNNEHFATVEYVLNSNQDTTVNEEMIFAAQELLSNSENIVLNHTYDISPARMIPITVNVEINSASGFSEEDLTDIIKTYFKGGDCVNFPYTFQGYDMGVTFDESIVKSDIMSLSDNITDLSITISNTDTLNTFEYYLVEGVVVNYV